MPGLQAGGGGSAAARVLAANKSRSRSRSVLGNLSNNNSEQEFDLGGGDDDLALLPHELLSSTSKDLLKKVHEQQGELDKRQSSVVALQRNVTNLSNSHHRDQKRIKELQQKLLDTAGKVGTLESLVSAQGKQLRAVSSSNTEANAAVEASQAAREQHPETSSGAAQDDSKVYELEQRIKSMQKNSKQIVTELKKTKAERESMKAELLLIKNLFKKSEAAKTEALSKLADQNAGAQKSSEAEALQKAKQLEAQLALEHQQRGTAQEECKQVRKLLLQEEQKHMKLQMKMNKSDSQVAELSMLYKSAQQRLLKLPELEGQLAQMAGKHEEMVRQHEQQMTDSAQQQAHGMGEQTSQMQVLQRRVVELESTDEASALASKQQSAKIAGLEGDLQQAVKQAEASKAREEASAAAALDANSIAEAAELARAQLAKGLEQERLLSAAAKMEVEGVVARAIVLEEEMVVMAQKQRQEIEKALIKAATQAEVAARREQDLQMQLEREGKAGADTANGLAEKVRLASEKVEEEKKAKEQAEQANKELKQQLQTQLEEERGASVVYVREAQRQLEEAKLKAKADAAVQQKQKEKWESEQQDEKLLRELAEAQLQAALAEKMQMGEQVDDAVAQCRAMREPFEKRIAALEEELEVTRDRVEEEARACRSAEEKLIEAQGGC
jgi:hypothetical protein